MLGPAKSHATGSLLPVEVLEVGGHCKDGDAEDSPAGDVDDETGPVNGSFALEVDLRTDDVTLKVSFSQWEMMNAPVHWATNMTAVVQTFLVCPAAFKLAQE